MNFDYKYYEIGWENMHTIKSSKTWMDNKIWNFN
jgi:hypothetical protein